MIKFTGDFSTLEKLGFSCNLAKTYYFKTKLDREHNLFIDVKTRQVEYSYEEDLIYLEGLYTIEDTDSNSNNA